MSTIKLLGSIEEYLPLLILLLGGGTVFYTNSISLPHTLLATSILGILTFLGIFYPLVIRKDIIQKRNSMIKSKFEEVEEKLKKKLKEIKEEIKNDNFDGADKVIDSMYSDISDFSELKAKTDLNKYLFISVIFFIFSLIFVIEDSLISNFQIQKIFIIKNLGIICLFIGIYGIIKVTYSWRRISK
ncbi:hypothetical protein J4477_01915 [Candidatus Pacearchaeota archaeon]|nr:hypothetical protein [Candidatus Pacearchaeota archaeon]